jgi:hypothetical protein
MKTTTLFKTLISVAIISSLTACGGGGSSDEPVTPIPAPVPPVETPTTIYSLDLSDAQGIFITGNSSAQTLAQAIKTSSSKVSSHAFSASSTSNVSASTDVYEVNTAYKILKDGTITEVTVQDSDGTDNERGAINIVHIDEITKNYKIIYIHNEDPGLNSAIPYLLYNDTARLFSLENALGERNIDDILGNTSGVKAKYKKVSATEGSDGQLFLDDDESVHIISKPAEDDESITATEVTDINGGWTITSDGQFILYAANNDYTTESDDIFAVNTTTQSRYDMNSLMAAQLNTGRIMLSDKIIHSFDGNTYLYDFNNAGTCSAYQIITGDDGLPSIKAKVEFANVSAVDFGGTTCLNDLPLEQVEISGNVYYKDSNFNLIDINWNKNTFANITKYTSGAGGNYNIPAELANEKTYLIGDAHSLTTSGDYIYRTGAFAESSNSYEIVEDGSASMDYFASDDVALERINIQTGDITVFFSRDSDFVLTDIDAVADGSMYVTGYQLTTGSSFVGTLNESGLVSVTSSSGSYDLPVIVTMHSINTTDFLAVDGDPRDWNIDFRTLSDAIDDQSTGNMDLTHYSEDTGNGFYYGLIEYTGTVNDNTKIELTLSNGDTLVSEDDTFTHFDSELTQITTSNASYAKGINFEFKLDLTSIGERTIVTSVSVLTQSDEIIDSME